MKRTLWIVAFLAVVGGFAGFQQYQSWSLNKKPQDDAAATPQGGAERTGRDAAGAVLSIAVGTKTLRRDVRPGYSYLAANDPRVHVGLGDDPASCPEGPM